MKTTAPVLGILGILRALPLSILLVVGCSSDGGRDPDPLDSGSTADAKVSGDGAVVKPIDGGPSTPDATVVQTVDGAVTPPVDGSVIITPQDDAAVVTVVDAATPPVDSGVVVVVPDSGVVVVAPDASPVVPRTLMVCAGATYTTIGAAIAAAAAGDTIEVCAGTYPEHLVVDAKPLTIRGTAGAAATIVDAGGSGTGLTVRQTTGLTIEGFTIRNGNNTAAQGGGVRCELSVLTLRSDVLIDNRGVGGGGLYASDCQLTVAATRFENNRGGSRGGGALIERGMGEIIDSHFTLNSGGRGGGLLLDGGNVALRRDMFVDNTASTAGGGVWHSSDAPIEDTTISDNDAGWTGGGIYLENHGPTLTRVTIANNISTNDGGGLYNHMGPIVLIDSLVTGNYCGDDGGGVRIFTANARLERNRIVNNEAFDSGGGVRVSHAPTQFIDNTFDGNRAVLGGGMDMDNDSSIVRGGVFIRNNASRGGALSIGLAPWRGSMVENVRFESNNSNRGALYIGENFQSIVLRGLTFFHNTGRRGAGLYAVATNFTLEKSVFNHNTASAEGGAIYMGSNPEWTEMCPCPPVNPSVAMAFVTMFDNRAPAGAALWTAAPSGFSMSSSILMANQVPTVTLADPAVEPGAVTPTWRYNDSMPASFFGMSEPTGSGNISADPAFVDPAGGNFQLRPGSPAIDAGDPARLDADGSRSDMGSTGGTL